jgi:hypothetical protein
MAPSLKATLMSATASTPTLWTLRLKLAAGCPKIAANQIKDLCDVYFPDRIRAMMRAERERFRISVQREACAP